MNKPCSPHFALAASSRTTNKDGREIETSVREHPIWDEIGLKIGFIQVIDYGRC
jgi:hypothetical protein